MGFDYIAKMDVLLCVMIFVFWIHFSDGSSDVPFQFTTRPKPVDCYQCAYVSFIRDNKPIAGLQLPHMKVTGAENLPWVDIPATVKNTKFCYEPLRPESQNVRTCTSQDGTCMKILIKKFGLQVAQRTCVPANTRCPTNSKELECRICNSRKCNNGNNLYGNVKIVAIVVLVLQCFNRR